MTYRSSTSKFEVLRLVVGAEESLQLIGGVTTHDAGLRLVGKLVRTACADENIHQIITALLPETYAGNSLDEIQGWIDSARRKGFDDPDASTGRGRAAKGAADVVLQLVDDSGATLFHD